MKHTLFLIIIIPFFFSCQNKEEKTVENKATYKLFGSDDAGWGFDIYMNDKKFIHQPHIPAINGVHPFKSKEDAGKVAELMIEKIEKNIIPPGVSVAELEELNILMNN